MERYRHRAYEWLGVEKVELAVVAELLLRGAQTVGELRGRAARMEPIKSLGELAPVLDELTEKGLVAYLTPKGRGAVVSHTYYSDGERERVLRDLGVTGGGAMPAPPSQETKAESHPPSQSVDELSELRSEVAELRQEVERLTRLVEG